MENLNLALFELLSAGAAPHPFWLGLASWMAQKSAWLCLAVFAWAAWRRPAQRWHVLAVMLAAGIASLVSRNLSESIGLPRPFMVDLGAAHIEHGARGALPSTHASVMYTMAFMCLLRRPLRPAGWLLLAVATLTGWARIYVGVHFPRDIAAGMLLGGVLALGLDAALARLPRAGAARSRWRPLADRFAAMAIGSRFSLYCALLFTAAAVLIGLLQPALFPQAFFRDGGAVENTTLFFYLVAMAMVALLRLPFVRLVDKAATLVLLLAFAAREAGLPSRLFGLPRVSAWLDSGSALMPKPLTLLGLALVLASTAWLGRRYAQGWRIALTAKQWRPTVTTVMVLTCITLVSCVLSGLSGGWPALAQAGALSGTSQLLMSLEETLELAAPLLAMLAFFQVQQGHGLARFEPGTRPAPARPLA